MLVLCIESERFRWPARVCPFPLFFGRVLIFISFFPGFIHFFLFATRQVIFVDYTKHLFNDLSEIYTTCFLYRTKQKPKLDRIIKRR